MENSKVVYIGLLGLGTVGSGVVKSLATNQEHIEQRTGFSVQVRRALVRDLYKPRRVSIHKELLTTTAQDILSDPFISVVVEVMGSVEPARTMIMSALHAGKHVITANKELLAKHGVELMATAEEMNVRLLFEASVGGGIPIVRMVESYLTANRIYAIQGILNGTCNYILTQMDEQGLSFHTALQTAQELGYAEADPESDVLGFDAAYKLSILANMAFPVYTHLGDVQRQGITEITPYDIVAAKSINGVIKLIGRASYDRGRVSLEVGPRIISKDHPLGGVRDVFNAVTLSADVVGELTFIGRGAGELPTASAVIEDLMEILRAPRPYGMRLPTLPPSSPVEQAPQDTEQQYYVRISSQVSQQPDQVLEILAGIRSFLPDAYLMSAVDVSTDEKSNTLSLLIRTVDCTFMLQKLASVGFTCELCLPFDGAWPKEREAIYSM